MPLDPDWRQTLSESSLEAWKTFPIAFGQKMWYQLTNQYWIDETDFRLRMPNKAIKLMVMIVVTYSYLDHMFKAIHCRK